MINIRCVFKSYWCMNKNDIFYTITQLGYGKGREEILYFDFISMFIIHHPTPRYIIYLSHISHCFTVSSIRIKTNRILLRMSLSVRDPPDFTFFYSICNLLRDLGVKQRNKINIWWAVFRTLISIEEFHCVLGSCCKMDISKIQFYTKF